MKCIRCQNDCKYPERANKKCPKCHGEFAFEPRTGDQMTDAAFQAAIDAVSSKNSVRWGVENLYYEICRRLRKKSFPIGFTIAGCVVAPIALIVAIISMFEKFNYFIPAVYLILASVIIWVNRRGPTVCVGLMDFNKMWERWNHVHGKPPNVIVRNPNPAKPRKMEADLGDYSFDRAVICDRARTVDVLLANKFHFENNCAVLSVEGYPPGPFETIREMLKRNPRLQVFALHDATPAGCNLAHRLATDPQWFAGKVKVIDVGLRPVHSKPFNGLFLKNVHDVIKTKALTPQEAEWLSMYSLELAAIRPEQVLKRLFRAMNKKFDPNESTDIYISDGGGFGFDADSFSSDADASDGGADSFG